MSEIFSLITSWDAHEIGSITDRQKNGSIPSREKANIQESDYNREYITIYEKVSTYPR